MQLTNPFLADAYFARELLQGLGFDAGAEAESCKNLLYAMADALEGTLVFISVAAAITVLTLLLKEAIIGALSTGSLIVPLLVWQENLINGGAIALGAGYAAGLIRLYVECGRHKPPDESCLFRLLDGLINLIMSGDTK